MEVNILGRKIPVRYISDKELNALGDDTDLLGTFANGTIFLSSSLKEEQARRVLLHELTHAIFNITGLENLLEEKIQEALADVSENLLEVFRTPEIVAFLSSTEDLA